MISASSKKETFFIQHTPIYFTFDFLSIKGIWDHQWNYRRVCCFERLNISSRATFLSNSKWGNTTALPSRRKIGSDPLLFLPSPRVRIRVLNQFRQLFLESSIRKYLSVYAGENHIAVVWSPWVNQIITHSSNNIPGITQSYNGSHVEFRQFMFNNCIRVYVDVSFEAYFGLNVITR